MTMSMTAKLHSKSRQKVLVVQTEKQKLLDITEVLKNQFTKVVTVHEKQALPTIEDLQPDLIFTDYSVSDMTGILFFKKLIENPVIGLIPTIFVSDSRSYDHRLNAFEIGAADFIHRPFSPDEVRRKSLIHIRNRRYINADKSVEMANLVLNPVTSEVKINGAKIALTDLEYKILHCLLTIPRQIITRSEIYEHVWGKDMTSTGRLDTQLYNLKKKIKKFNGKIKSVNKIGMRILAEESIFFQETKKAERPLRLQDPRP
jgi:two-component system response regulator MprA